MTTATEAAPSVRPGIISKLRNLGLAFCFIALIASNVASFVSSAFNAFVGDLLAAAGFVTAYHLLKSDNMKLKKTVATHKTVNAKMQRAIDKYGVAVKKYQSVAAAQQADIAKKSKTIGKYKIAVGKYQAAVSKATTSMHLQQKELIDFKNRVAVRQLPAQKAGKAIASRTVKVAKTGIARLPAEALPYVGVVVLVGGIAYDINSMCHNMEDLNALYESCGMADRVDEGWMQYLCNPPIPSADQILSKLPSTTEMLQMVQ